MSQAGLKPESVTEAERVALITAEKKKILKSVDTTTRYCCCLEIHTPSEGLPAHCQHCGDKAVSHIKAPLTSLSGVCETREGKMIDTPRLRCKKKCCYN